MEIKRDKYLNVFINVLASAVGSLSNPTKIKATFKSVIQSDILLKDNSLEL